LYPFFMINVVEIRRRRCALGFSQDALAKLAGVHINTIKGAELGTHEPCVTTLVEIARALRCELSDLVTSKRRKSA